MLLSAPRISLLQFTVFFYGNVIHSNSYIFLHLCRSLFVSCTLSLPFSTCLSIIVSGQLLSLNTRPIVFSSLLERTHFHTRRLPCPVPLHPLSTQHPKSFFQNATRHRRPDYFFPPSLEVKRAKSAVYVYIYRSSFLVARPKLLIDGMRLLSRQPFSARNVL